MTGYFAKDIKPTWLLLVRTMVPFPLTLTLSPRRGNSLLPSQTNHGRLNLSPRWTRFSLSPRERAGVRGKRLRRSSLTHQDDG
jgi:hypothetical protein